MLKSFILLHCYKSPTVILGQPVSIYLLGRGRSRADLIINIYSNVGHKSMPLLGVHTKALEWMGAPSNRVSHATLHAFTPGLRTPQQY